MLKERDGREEYATCENGHKYPEMAGVCPYCAEDVDVAARDAEGRERFETEAAR